MGIVQEQDTKINGNITGAHFEIEYVFAQGMNVNYLN